jgi:hypothetical protein
MANYDLYRDRPQFAGCSRGAYNQQMLPGGFAQLLRKVAGAA